MTDPEAMRHGFRTNSNQMVVWSAEIVVRGEPKSSVQLNPEQVKRKGERTSRVSVHRLASFLDFDHITRATISNRNLDNYELRFFKVEGSSHYPELRKLQNYVTLYIVVQKNSGSLL